MASVTISLPDKDAKLGCGFESSCRVVTKVQPGSIADQHEVAPGFILISINGHDCDAMADISEIKEKLKERPATLLLVPPEEEPQGQPEGELPQEGVINLTATEGGLGFGVSSFPPAEKIFVKKVDLNSWASQQGLREGFQLLKVQGRDAGSLSADEFRSAMKSQRPLELSFLPVPESVEAAEPQEPEAEKPEAKEESSKRAKKSKVEVQKEESKEETSKDAKDPNEEELVNLKKKLAESAEELQKAQTELSQALKKSEASQAQLTKLQEELEAKNRDLKELQESPINEQEIARLKEQVAVQEEELKRTKEEVQTAKANKEKRKSQNQSMEARLKQQEPQDGAIAGAEDDFAKRVRESAEVRDLKRQVELEIQTLRSELEALKAQVGSMRSSFTELPGASSIKPLSTEAPEEVNLFRAAQPLLRPNTEKRSQAVQAVEAALQQGASPNSWQGPGSPLQAAVQARAPDFVRSLLKAHADPGEIDAHGVSLLHLATFHGEAEVSKLLLEANANPNVTDRYAQTPLFFAPTRQICMTLHNFNADVNAINSKGQSPLHLAAKAGLGDVMHWLAAKASPDVLSSKDASGQRPADYAKAAGLRGVLGKLEGRAAKSPQTTPTSPSPSRTSPSCGVASPQESRTNRQGPFRLTEPSK